ncbi:MAG: hypothetical protein JNK11_10070, partial [Alphaproteobacteria bacterium]|nr:hypothetical protein [Alphaproteobacteria bacterium]
LIRPLVLRYVHGAPRPLPGKPPKPTVEDEEGAGAGLVKVSVWVPEQNAGHVQLLAKELRKTGVPKPDAKPEPKNGGQRPG